MQDHYKLYNRDFRPEVLTAAREAKGMTKTDVAVLMGYGKRDGRSRMCKWEGGDNRPSLQNAIKLCEILGIKIDELAPRTGSLHIERPTIRAGRAKTFDAWNPVWVFTDK